MIEHHVQFDRQVKNCRFLDRSEPVTRTVNPVTAEAASAAVNERMTGLLENIATGIDSIDLKTAEFADEVVSLSISLSRIIVENLVGESQELKEKRLTKILSEALARPETPVGVYVNPINLDCIKNKISEETRTEEINLQIDDSIEPGECRVEFDTYELLSRMETQLDEIQAGLTEIIDE
ncbi:MAG: FliH/SctL family protein [Mariniblastus sp.]|nr:FliH/SctL family protein [Mariniblastus sp.]MDG2183003.1 FliH/SctL family protein [Mariniblastus sp.]